MFYLTVNYIISNYNLRILLYKIVSWIFKDDSNIKRSFTSCIDGTLVLSNGKKILYYESMFVERKHVLTLQLLDDW